MSPGAQMAWLTVMLVGFMLSALYSGIETGVYGINRVRLEILADRGQPAARRLRRLLGRPNVVLATLLIGNNMANYMGTSSLAVLLEGQGLHVAQVITVNVLVSTFVLFVFGETLPKDYFAAHTDQATYRFAGFLDVSRRLFLVTGLLPLIVTVSRLVTGAIHGRQHAGPLHPRRQVHQFMREGVGQGLLSDEQSSIMERVLSLSDRRLRDEMAPWPQVITVALEATPDMLWQLADRTSRSRFPVVDRAGRVHGILPIIDALFRGREACPPVRDLMQPAVTLAGDMTLRAGLRRLQEQHAHMAIVVDRHDKPIGIVTPKDLVEPITGELSSW